MDLVDGASGRASKFGRTDVILRAQPWGNGRYFCAERK